MALAGAATQVRPAALLSPEIQTFGDEDFRLSALYPSQSHKMPDHERTDHYLPQMRH